MKIDKTFFKVLVNYCEFMDVNEFKFFDQSKISTHNTIHFKDVSPADQYHPDYYSYECIV